MALNLGLNAQEQAAYDAATLTNQRLDTRVEVWDLNHNPLGDVSAMFQTGQANDDTAADVGTSATVELFDPLFVARFDEAENVGASQPPNRMLHVERGTFVESIGRFVYCPAFTGPVTKIDREDDVLKLECQSKESNALRNLWKPIVVKKGTNKIEAIRQIMAQSVGERFFDLATTSSTLAADLSLATDTTPWAACRDLASSLGFTLFYDARGVLICRPPVDAPSWVFRTGVGGNITSSLQRGYASDGVVNAVRFTGGTPKGKKAPVVAEAVAPASHPASPTNLAINGVPQFYWTEITADEVTDQKVADARALSSLNSSLLESVALSFNALVNGRLESGDVVRVITDRLVVDLRYRTGSRPFGLGTATYGYNARVSKPIRNIRRP